MVPLTQRWSPMKKQANNIKELANYFDQELQTVLPITILPNGALGYKNFLVKQLSNANWGLFNVGTQDLLNQYYLKSCALMAAKFYNNIQIANRSEIKELDNHYRLHYTNLLLCKHNIVLVDKNRYPIMLTRMEESSFHTDLCKQKISKLFKSSAL